MSFPITDNRYFTLGVDNVLAQELDVFTPEEYEREYPRISSTFPITFSVNLKQEIEQFLTSAPPQFNVVVDSAIGLACYYYCDWDTMVVVIDEFIQTEVLQPSDKQLMLYAPSEAAQLNEFVNMLSEALQTFMGIIIGLLTRIRAPAIAEYGCCYRWEYIDDRGNTFFHLRNPTQVYAELEGEFVHEPKNFTFRK